MANMATSRPARKVIAASITAAIVATTLAALRGYPPDIMPLVLADALMAAAFAFVAGYLVPPADRDRATPTAMLQS
ncbi:hypothetical protein DEA8626_01053 [Defluviimonas aquaemixtae]|uniref:Uncharacterized protein n=1 Tax=Albidovulum aquaemixtae TaxID=1542388 RepID=A0A2R8B4S8_9RHOB|nr:hypothetical protein [Defluviimonas aquaemixtae]SPH17530.1 hypothetical protein DEA8626_01053 [Defluviimonas aquaemixtae]